MFTLEERIDQAVVRPGRRAAPEAGHNRRWLIKNLNGPPSRDSVNGRVQGTAYDRSPVQMLDSPPPAAAFAGACPPPRPGGPHDPQPPSSRQLNYLRGLADRTGQTFAWPNTKAQASREIRRLKNTRPSPRLERTIERLDVSAEQAAREANCDVPAELGEVSGYGSTATWRQRS